MHRRASSSQACDGSSGLNPLLDLFKDLKVPVHTVLGNHDSLNGFRKTAPRGPDFPGYCSFDLQGVHFVMLYSAGTGKEFGRLEEKQLLWFHRGEAFPRSRRAST